jgi:hypothetical protein
LTDLQDKVLVDFVGRAETLEVDMGSICRTLLLPRLPNPIGNRNVSTTGPCNLAEELSSGAVVDAIRKRYAMDFDMFGYPRSPERDASAVVAS